jgi:hypothetical protein
MCRTFTNCPPVSLACAETYERTRFICTNCFLENGGHLFESEGPGHRIKCCTIEGEKHRDDSTLALKEFAKWIMNVADSNDEKTKNHLLSALFPSLKVLEKDIEVPSQEKVPSLFLVKTAMLLGQTKKYKMKVVLDSDVCSDFGKNMGYTLLNSRQVLKRNRESLEEPKNLVEYSNAFPRSLFGFFSELLRVVEKKKNFDRERKRKSRNAHYQPKPLNDLHIRRMACFFCSIILTIAFGGLKIWLTTIMASLSGKPQLLPSLQRILRTVHIISHSRKHEQRLEKKRLLDANPEERIVKGNYWNVAVIDNIDFKAKTFGYGNILDKTRKTSHATLRMLFQFELPTGILLQDLGKNPPEMSPNLFGTSSFVEELEKMYHNIFQQLLEISEDFDADEVSREIKKLSVPGCHINPPNVVILKPGPEPNKDRNVFEACDQYWNDVGLDITGHLDIFADQSIFQRLIKYHDKYDAVRVLLGQWHTSKDMCAALIAAFSAYGIFDMAALLGVRFLDKLDDVVDYVATCRVLELLWVAVGIAIHKYLKISKKRIDHILKGKNDALKVWYLYFRWAGYWRGHKIGIRTGDFQMQIKNLSAFAPLFPVTGKANYARSVTFFLSYLHDEPSLRELLYHVASVNLTREGRYFAFDEALERFGVKFIKNNIGGDLINPENLRRQIQGAQAEKERLNKMIAEFTDDPVIYKRGERAIQSRKDALWSLATKLTEAFLLPDSKKSPLFENAKEMTTGGVQKLLACYKKGIKRLELILKQDVYKTAERDTTGRRSKDLTRIKYVNLRAEKKKDEDNMDQDPEYEVEEILAKRTHWRRIQYLVKWKGYPREEATWEPVENLANSQKSVADFELRNST